MNIKRLLISSMKFNGILYGMFMITLAFALFINFQGQWGATTFFFLFVIIGVPPFSICYIYFRQKIKRLAPDMDRVEQLHSILEDSLVGTYVIQGQKIVYANKRFCDLFGYRREEVLQENFLKNAIPGNAYKQIMKNITKRLNGGDVQDSYTFPISRKDNQIRIVEVFPKLSIIEGEASITGVIIDVTERENIKTQLEDSERRYKSLFENSPDIVCSFDLDGSFLSANPASLRVMGRNINDILHKPFSSLIYPEDLAKTIDYFEEVQKGKPQHYETRVFRNDGHVVPLEVTNFPMIVNDEIVGVYALAKDISKEKEFLVELEETQHKFDSLYNNSLDAIFEIDIEGNYLSVNKVAEVLTGYSKDELLQLGIKDLCVPLEKAMATFDQVKKGDVQRIELTLIHKDGRHLTIDINAVPIYKDDTINVIAFVRDITDKKRSEEEVKELAYKDTLTGLPNRYSFTKQLTAAIQRSKEKGKTLGVLFIDWDEFKKINDTLGHNIGDFLLQKVAEKMQGCIRNQDIIARQGGDEFLVLLEDVDKGEICLISERLIKEFNNPIELVGHEVFITPSIGINMYPQYGYDASSIIKHADLAMYLAKEKGKNNYQFFTESLNDQVTRKLQLEHAMRKALENEEFTLFYQPQFNLKNNRIVGVEALLRWNPDFGFVSPAEFIPIAEETGLIVEIGEFVLQEACRTCEKWSEEGITQVPISINVSARQFKEPNFIDTVIKVLQDTKLQPSKLEIEITESVMLDVDEALKVINQLKELGVKIAIDDFGVGYSSLNIIKDIEIDKLKIDQSFLNDVMNSSKSAGLLEAIIQMGRNIGTSVVVEGIEDENQVDFLMPYGVIGQGYYFSRPLPPLEFESFLK